MARILTRERVFNAVKMTGAFAVWRSLKSDQLLVVNYHRVLGQQDDNPFDDGVVTCDPQVFDEQIRLLAKKRNIISMADFVRCLDHGNRLPANPTLITFDDGYADNFSHAFPVLEKYSAPACFFLPTNRLTERRLEWWDHIAYIMKNAEKGCYTTSFGGEVLSVDLGQPDGRKTATAELIARAKKTDKPIDQLFEEFAVARPDPALESSHIMSDEQINRILAEPGFSIGAHSVTHRVLSTLSEAEQLHELSESKKILEDRYDTTIDAFAYPVGDDGHYDWVTVKAAQAAGYRCAFNFRRGARGVDVQSCSRFDIDRTWLPNNTRGIFHARTAGFFY
jgi:peptidoglycan/xylan/chitin deacetylase (PgdA/CDA1 family)